MNRRGRILAVLLVLLLGYVLVAARLLYLQVYKSADLAGRAERQQERLVKLEAKEGNDL